MIGFIVFISVGTFFLSKIVYKNLPTKIFWFFGVISVLNIIYGLFFEQLINDDLIRFNIIMLPVPVVSFCVGHIFWKRIASNKLET